ncbi:MAG: hypothetical protein JHC95_10180 [Solirubrobacteraceae bacterium]|nr:hypothetical protein [Solirubrobacteraceae bacterium]
MSRKQITTRHQTVACGVCGRTLLRGEQAEPYLAGGSRRMVCELCTQRATQGGWIREGLGNAPGVGDEGRDRRGSLLRRLRRRETPERTPEPTPAPRRVTATPVVPPQETWEDTGDEPAAEPAYVEASSPPSAAQSKARRLEVEIERVNRTVHAVPTNTTMKLERALELFNKSDQPRKVSGIARSLGPPVVAVHPSLTEGAIVSIVVAWELCWYRYEVDLADEASAVRLVTQGTELEELPVEEQTANAAADERGGLVMAA